MELDNGNVIARFIMLLFILLVLMGLSPMLYSGLSDAKIGLSCSVNYGIICLIIDAILPLIVIIIIAGLIGLLKGR